MANKLEDIFSYESMIKAAKIVARKKSAGVDDTSAKEAVLYVEQNYKSIISSIVDGTYKPNYVKLVKIPKKNSNKMRTLAIGTMIDRVILRCIYVYLESIYDCNFDDCSFGFRKNYNCHKAVLHVCNYLVKDYRYIISIDLKDCFGNIDHDMVLYLLRDKVENKEIIDLINKFLKSTYVTGRTKIKSYKGCPQGNSSAPIIANIVLSQLDKELHKRNLIFARYADDIVILAKSYKAALRIKFSISKFIGKYLKLPVNEDKSKIYDIDDGFTMLGFFIYKTGGNIHIVPKKDAYTNIENALKKLYKKEPYMTKGKFKNSVCGWISYYAIAEISSYTKKLDFLIIQNNKKYIKKFNTKSELEGFSCHDFFKEKMHLFKMRYMAEIKEDGYLGETYIYNIMEIVCRSPPDSIST